MLLFARIFSVVYIIGQHITIHVLRLKAPSCTLGKCPFELEILVEMTFSAGSFYEA